MLKSTSRSVAQIPAEVGYESESAFNRAFEREFGLPPARFRNQAKLARNKPVRSASSKGRRSANR
jgi:transcriptional regulator GlxA family with amidase domain